MGEHFGRQRSCPGDSNRKSADSSPRTHVQFAHVGISNGRISATHGRRRYETMFHMHSWPDRRLLDLLKIELPIIQAPMAGSDSVALARSVSSTGALGSLACALLSPDAVREAVHAIRDEMPRPVNLNFFCHKMEAPDAAAIAKW